MGPSAARGAEPACACDHDGRGARCVGGLTPGEPDSGKSTLLQHLDAARAAPAHESHGPLGFRYLDLGDGGAPSTTWWASADVLRTNVYTIQGSDAAMTATLPYAFPPVTIAADGTAQASLRRLEDALVVLVLDWRAPWTWASQLEVWLGLVHALVSAAHAADDARRDEMQQRGTYAELTPVAALPCLKDGVLDGTYLADNLGVPLLIVGTHADALDTLLAERQVTDAQLDTVQQMLRTVALRYGAPIVSTTTARPSSFDAVQALVREALRPEPSAAPAVARAPTTADAAQLWVPRGWDSWAKIEALREPFSCATWDAAWTSGRDGTAGGAPRLAAMLAEHLPGPPRGAARGPRVAPPLTLPPESEFLAELLSTQPAAEDSAAPAASTTLDLPAVGEVLAAQSAGAQTLSSLSPQKRSATPGHDERRTLHVTTPKQTEVLHSFFQSRTCRR